MSKRGSLSEYFVGAGAKVLKDTEVNPQVSNGHELQGVDTFRAFLGAPAQKQTIPITYVWLSDDADPVTLQLNGTWYNSRLRTPQRVPEYRLYYPKKSEDVVLRAKAGDTLFLCQPKNGPLLALFCQHNSTIERQLLWLFGLALTADNEISQVDLREQNDRTIDYVTSYVLELIGVEVVETEDDFLDRLIKKFGEAFPPTQPFSAFARELLKDVDGRDDPDGTLIAWMDFEQRLFMTLEKHIVGKRLAQGFMTSGVPDVDGFVQYSLQVQNRRKSRAGHAFAGHVDALLKLHDIRYVREATTEKRNGPDFLFPDEASYHDQQFDVARLTMLGAKTSCKDRWRQVLAEANRIESKHLITLEPGISLAQTTEMKSNNLQLVLPAALHSTFLPQQQADLMSVSRFLELVRSRQAA
ncbi:type II restriction endonuclease [Kaistia granuli]|uniref:type II restriction endonuclease n=1 Tax=Kaistia granuli TaxID=363259 RepID=UPI0003675E90|nr:type II restriction endonuclease [Kaistia granuli]